MEDLRELLNIYFTDEEDKIEPKENSVFENTYESIYNSFIKEEKYITNVYKEISEGREENIISQTDGAADTAENIIERAYESAGKIGGADASVYFNNYSAYGSKNNVNSSYTENADNIENEARVQNNAAGKITDPKHSYSEIKNLYQNNNYNDTDGTYSMGSDSKAENTPEFFTDHEYSERSGDKTEIEEILYNPQNYTAGTESRSESFFENKDIYGGADYLKNKENYGSYLSEEFYKNENRYGGAGETAVGTDSPAFVPSFASDLNDFSFFSAKPELQCDEVRHILNEWNGSSGGNYNITNNISPTLNLYPGESGGNIDIDEIAEKIGELLAEAAAGSANGFYR